MAATANRTFVKKRDGSLQQWDRRKIERAMFGAFNEVRPESIPNLAHLAKEIEKNVMVLTQVDGGFHIDAVQDVVESTIAHEFPDVAKAYGDYRRRRDEVRAERLRPDPNAVAEYVHAAKYAREIDGRLETFGETVSRVEDMHVRKYGPPIGASVLPHQIDLVDQIYDAFKLVRQKRVLPAMRSLQFGGTAIERNNCRMYNCAFTHVNRLRVFGEIFHALLSGCGVGFSVQMHHVDQLPELRKIDRGHVRHYQIPDSIEGWADAVNQLVAGHFVAAAHVEFDYSKIRPEGSPLSTGGCAPGHLPLKECLERLRAIFAKASGRKLRPIEAHDAVCVIAEAVLSGGIRRSSLISLFSLDDTEMIYAKAHENFRPAHGSDPGVNSQRQMANNSAVFVRSQSKQHRAHFDRIMKLSQEWGEPGFYFTDDPDFGTNPCGEIGLMPVLDRAWSGGDGTLGFEPSPTPKRAELSSASAKDVGVAIEEYGSATGFQFCNLCEVNVAACKTTDEFFEAVRAAAFIGTLQAGYTTFDYLGPVTELIARREALLGVGLTGIMDNPEIGLNPRVLREAARIAVAENVRVAKLIGINPAARVTTVKPSGTASLALGCVGSGIHHHHARRYFRRITANPNEPVAKAFAAANPHMVEHKSNGDLALVFPVQAPDAARTTKDEPAIQFVEDVMIVYDNWISPGSSTKANKLNLTHNVSCTVTVASDDERLRVTEKVWEDRDRVAAMSFAPATLDKKYPHAPREEVTTLADETRWNELITGYKPVDYSSATGKKTAPGQEAACAGGACEV